METFTDDSDSLSDPGVPTLRSDLSTLTIWSCDT